MMCPKSHVKTEAPKRVSALVLVKINMILALSFSQLDDLKMNSGQAKTFQKTNDMIAQCSLYRLIQYFSKSFAVS